MNDPAPLLEALVSLSDRDRLAFARWAASQPLPAAAEASEWGNTYVAQSVAEDAAERAFDVLRNDGTVPRPPREFAFDPCFPETGWEAWRAATVMVRAMAAALASADETALAQLRTSFERLGLASASMSPNR